MTIELGSVPAASAQLLVTAVFALAGIAKLTGGAQPSKTIRAAGLPAPGWMNPVVGLFEILLAATALVSGASLAFFVAAGAVVGMSAVLLAARQRGYTAGCGCFGSSAAEPLAIEFGRTAVLLVAAVLAAVTADRALPYYAAATLIAAGVIVSSIVVVYSLAAQAGTVLRPRALGRQAR